MSIPTSAMARIARGCTKPAGETPALKANTRPSARRLNQPSAIWERQELPEQRTRTRVGWGIGGLLERPDPNSPRREVCEWLPSRGFRREAREWLLKIRVLVRLGVGVASLRA